MAFAPSSCLVFLIVSVRPFPFLVISLFAFAAFLVFAIFLVLAVFRVFITFFTHQAGREIRDL